MAYVKVFPKGDSKEDRDAALEAALKIFKRKVDREGVLKDLRGREEYLPPSKKRRIKKQEAIKRERKLNSKRRRLFRDK